MSRIKNITPSAIALQMFTTSTPEVNFTSQSLILNLTPGEDVDSSSWSVTDISNASYNQDLIAKYVNNGVITVIP